MSRYWDCCKPHCAWSGNGPAIPTCDSNNSSQGVNDLESACNGGPAFMCHSFAPWSAGDQAAYGFVAYNAGNCGDCFLIEFTGGSSRGVAQPSIAGKRMIVQKVNVGGIAGEQMDLLIPGGGVGDFNGCSQQWGTGDLGAQYGGFSTSCNNDPNCILNMCQNAFGRFSELMAGCEWFVNWLHAADNPDMRFESISCPNEIRAVSGIG